MAHVSPMLALALCLCFIAMAVDAAAKDGIAFGNNAITSLGAEISRVAR
jgi:hypothetical protein